MKFAFSLLVLLPLAMSAVVDEKRFIETIYQGFDLSDITDQIKSHLRTGETEQQCEQTICPEIVNKIDRHNDLITSLICTAVCKEAQISSAHFLTTPGLGNE